MSKKLKLAEVLSLKYLIKYVWSPSSKELVYLWNDGGVIDAWVVSANGEEQPYQLTSAKNGVSALEWSSNNELAIIVDGNVYLYDDTYRLKTQLTTEGGYRSKISFTPNGKILTFTDGKLITFYNCETKDVKRIKPLGEVFAGKFSQTIGNDSFNWSPNGDMFLYTYIDANQKPYLALLNSDGEHIWTSTANEYTIGEGSWVNNNSFVFRLAGRYRATKVYYLATIPPQNTWKDYSHINVVSRFSIQKEEILRASVEQEKGGMISNVLPINENEILFGLELDSYFHYYTYNINERSLIQITKGEFEDFGQMGDKASLAPTKTSFVFASNRTHRIERQLFIYDLLTESLRQITCQPVTNTLPLWSPDGLKIAYFHADCKRNGDLWVYDLKENKSYQLTNSMPCGLSEKLHSPELITYKGALDWDIDAFLYKPKNFDSSKRYPAIVWVHGGPIRQMRGSFHPSGTYSMYYILNQYLASQGYVVISPNFRGGIGYGSAFRYGLHLKKGIDDTKDIVNAARYLKDLSFVDENKVAVYGLSYGGYMTLHSLTQYPSVFAAGINLAGLWDIAQWARWIKKEYGNYKGDAYFGGEIEDRPDLWSLGSPVTYRDNLCKPLMSLQGTADLNVDFDQLNSLVKDLTAMGADHEAIYYPNEAHSFRWRHTWCDALPKMMAFFEANLK